MTSRSTLVRRVLVLVGVLSGFGLTAQTATAAPTPGIAIAGLESGPAVVGADLRQARALGADVVRVELPWSWIEPEARGQRDPARLAAADASMQQARALGIRVVLLLNRTPCWTSTAPADDPCEDGTSYPPADYAAYAELAAFVAARYADVLAGLEVWNEPDQSNERYWAGPDKVARYVRLLKATYPAVKAAAPRVPVLGGSFVGKDGRWLKAMYREGARGSYDGLSVHFYTDALLGLRQTRVVQRAAGDTKPLWLLEAGWTSCKPKRLATNGQPCVSRAVQATNLRDLFAQVRTTSWLRAVVVYKLRDDPSDLFGLMTTGGTRKPSFGAVQRSWTQGAGRPSPLRLALASRRGALRITGSGPGGDTYRMTVRLNGVLRFRAEFVVDSDNRFVINLPRVLGTRGLAVRVEQRWSGAAITRSR